jgi:uncharacterized membrane protein YoaK (UPF0700 family)
MTLSEDERKDHIRRRWMSAVAMAVGLLLFAVGVLHVFHGDYVMAPPSFLVAVLLLVHGARGWKDRQRTAE